jgi:hypothetical protein
MVSALAIQFWTFPRLTELERRFRETRRPDPERDRLRRFQDAGRWIGGFGIVLLLIAVAQSR